MTGSGWARCVQVGAILLAMTTAVQAADDPAAAAKYRLRYRFTPGESVYFTAANTTDRGIQYSDRKVQTNEGSDSLKHYRVLNVTPDGNAVLELTIDRTRMFVEQDNVRFAYDSTRDSSVPEGFEAVSDKIGRPWLHLTVTPRGETVDSRDPRQVESPDSETQVSDRHLNSSDFISRVLPLLPDDEVAIGAIWKEPFTIEIPESEFRKKSIRLQRVYKLQEVDGEIATISIKTQVLTADKTPKQEGVIAQILYSGSFRVDMAKGLLVSRDLRLDQQVSGFDGPATVMSLKLRQLDELAPAGAATPVPEERTADAAEAKAQGR